MEQTYGLDMSGVPEATIARLKCQLECLPILLGGVSGDALERQPKPGKWSARENLAHLARYEEMFLDRVQRIRSEDRPALPRYRAEDDARWPQWLAMSNEEILSRLRSLRSELVGVVEQLSPAEFSRVGVHPLFGEMTLVEWLEFFLLHEAHHLLAVMQRVRTPSAS